MNTSLACSIIYELFHILGKKIGRLLNESQLLWEHCIQVRELFQAEIDIRQNEVMKILTIVTTGFAIIPFLPLSEYQESSLI